MPERTKGFAKRYNSDIGEAEVVEIDFRPLANRLADVMSDAGSWENVLLALILSANDYANDPIMPPPEVERIATNDMIKALRRVASEEARHVDDLFEQG